MSSKAIKEVVATKSIRKSVESIKRKKIVDKKVVNLSEFRELKKNVESSTVLVVDDDEIMRSALKRILENEKYDVVMAEDGLELSKVLENSKLDLILLDVNLPWVNGYELCDLIKGHHSLKEVPIIFVSARKTEEDIQAGFDAGCTDYITKPFEVDYIMEVINKTLLKSG